MSLTTEETSHVLQTARLISRTNWTFNDHLVKILMARGTQLWAGSSGVSYSK